MPQSTPDRPRIGSGHVPGNGTRPRRQLRDNVKGITQKSIKKLARRGGVGRITNSVHGAAREAVVAQVKNVVQHITTKFQHEGRKTAVTPLDIVYAIKAAPGFLPISFDGTPFDDVSSTEPESQRARAESIITPPKSAPSASTIEMAAMCADRKRLEERQDARDAYEFDKMVCLAAGLPEPEPGSDVDSLDDDEENIDDSEDEDLLWYRRIEDWTFDVADVAENEGMWEEGETENETEIEAERSDWDETS